MDQKERDEQINIIMEFFDWEKVYTAMKALDWTRRDATESPSMGELIATALDLLSKINEDGNAHSTGGFTAYMEDGRLGLSFILCDVHVESPPPPSTGE